MNSIDYSRIPVDTLAALVPVWLEREAIYGNSKYGDNNPQLMGSMADRLSPAYLEFPNYFGRFLRFYKYADDENQLLLNASQAAGKFMSAGRALTRVLVEVDQGVSRQEADVRTFDIAQQTVGTLSIDHSMDSDGLGDYFDVFVEPRLMRIHKDIEAGNVSRALDISTRLLASQMQLFAGFSATTGVMAKPGISSTDQAIPWVPEADLLH